MTSSTIEAPGTQTSDASPASRRAHGGTLVQRWAEAGEIVSMPARWRGAARLRLAPHQLSDAVLIANGAFSPLTGFLGERDYASVVEDMRLDTGVLWPIPVTLTVQDETAAALGDGIVILEGPEGETVGWMEVTERYRIDPLREAGRVYGTEDAAHPGVARLLRSGTLNLAGPIRLLRDAIPAPYPGYPSEPMESRAIFAERGWRTVVGFQTRNPIHRAHEYIQKCALEMVDGLFLHPLVGETRAEDIPADVRMRCYEALLDNYYPAGRTVMGVYPAAMRYAGPREAIFHALARKNYGCTHFIVGRDHAGVGSYYGTYAAQEIFHDIPAADLGIVPLFFDNTFWCRTCGHMASEKTCPHPKDRHVSLSGTQVRQKLSAGEDLPSEFSRREIAEILGRHYRGAAAAS
ncbi:MAG: sulfate adenylyltransferase [Gemmatimonadetes bacterium]|nr:sulfate adenylyltransferase [Gemmatimonadota bacterium]